MQIHSDQQQNFTQNRCLNDRLWCSQLNDNYKLYRSLALFDLRQSLLWLFVMFTAFEISISHVCMIYICLFLHLSKSAESARTSTTVSLFHTFNVFPKRKCWISLKMYDAVLHRLCLSVCVYMCGRRIFCVVWIEFVTFEHKWHLIE